MHKCFRFTRPGIRMAGIAGILGVAIAQQAGASGFRVPEISILGLGTSNALVANTEELGALAYNPAGMSFHDGKALAAGVVHIGYEHSVTRSGVTTDGNGEDTFIVPNLFVSARDQNAHWSFGLAVNAPFGLETRYPNGTFGSLSSSAHPQISRIKMFNVNPNFAYKIDETSSFAIGMMYYDVKELIFNTHGIEITGSGAGYGFNLGYQKKFGSFDIGIAYRSNVETDLDGTFDATSAGTPPAVAANAKLEFPSMLQAGVLVKATDNLSIEFDAEYTGWDTFDHIVVNYSTSSTTTSTNNWDNSWAYRLGFIYKLNNKTKLLFGYSYDETPQPDSFFSARVPDNDRQLFSVGVTHDFGDWNLEAGYMHVVVDDRTFNTSNSYGGFPTEANGTNAYNGTYKSEVNLLGVGLTMKF